MGGSDRENETTIETTIEAVGVTGIRAAVVEDLTFRDLRGLTACFGRDVFETKTDRRLGEKASNFCSGGDLGFFTVSRIFGALMLVSKTARFFLESISILFERGVDEGEKELHEGKGERGNIKKSR